MFALSIPFQQRFPNFPLSLKAIYHSLSSLHFILPPILLFFCSDFLTAICTFLVLLSSYFLCYAGCFSYFPAVANLSASFLSGYSKLPCDGFSTCILLYFLVCVSSLSDSIDRYPFYLCATSSLSFCLPLFL
jgi:hypothetical protein